MIEREPGHTAIAVLHEWNPECAADGCEAALRGEEVEKDVGNCGLAQNAGNGGTPDVSKVLISTPSVER
jgi:hypothetical protein